MSERKGQKVEIADDKFALIRFFYNFCVTKSICLRNHSNEERNSMTVDEYKQEVKRTRPQLLFIARKYMGNEEEAEDVVQDVLLKLWQICDTLRMPIDGFATILVRNHCVDLLRRRPKSQDISENFTDESREDDERIEKMMKIIDRLPTLQQTLIRLRHMENMEMKDIAALVGSNEVAVRKALSRARQSIKNKYLNDKEHE